MKKIYVIGVGSQNRDHRTIQTIKVPNEADAFFVIDKRPATNALIDVRNEIRRFIEDPAYRIVRAGNSERDGQAVDYKRRVDEWHRARATMFEGLIRDKLEPNECGAFLV
ncbi:hypothetical protein ACD578_27290 (plasmid) [Microvirga sp. RSM25]|uniref:hypothetical protein n=1 Tax=Microvirga sp. RSM25 TaxID=3273802 RepID=UPI00384EA2E5